MEIGFVCACVYLGPIPRRILTLVLWCIIQNTGIASCLARLSICHRLCRFRLQLAVQRSTTSIAEGNTCENGHLSPDSTVSALFTFPPVVSHASWPVLSCGWFPLLTLTFGTSVRGAHVDWDECNRLSRNSDLTRFYDFGPTLVYRYGCCGDCETVDILEAWWCGGMCYCRSRYFIHRVHWSLCFVLSNESHNVFDIPCKTIAWKILVTVGKL